MLKRSIIWDIVMAYTRYYCMQMILKKQGYLDYLYMKITTLKQKMICLNIYQRIEIKNNLNIVQKKYKT